VKQLKDELVASIKQLPEGPGKDAFLEYVPTLDEVAPEVHRLATRVQNLERELGSANVQSLEKEITDLESRVAAASDLEAKAQLETALGKKRQARGHYATAREGIPRTQAQIEAIVSSLQEARARVAALGGRLADPAGLNQAQEAVFGISREVKYLSQAVEETVKLLN
jgi:chromosome segregation ATPase